ncbi:MAG: arabinan endo-1,5-alpha-L-arabinosidase [Bacteroidales bacterium]|nr:arabinan endo-1,5-alpha-L-arabinosidase [Bacteroidales bacterium]MBN2762054.1 arabinan endo-1,5-alpha-L-arabinosidase [Bacteroidales bacterium]
MVLILVGCKSNLVVTDFEGPGYRDDYSAIWEPKNYKQWGTYNVHDPACVKAGEYFYLFSTDAVYFRERPKKEDFPEEMGHIQVRRSKDLVSWEFVGWAFDTIPGDAIEYLQQVSGGRNPENIWAPYVTEWNGQYRMYYAVSLFGAKTSYLGLAVSSSPEGPWEQKGCVVKTGNDDMMNAIDPSVIIDNTTGRHWMHYGSYFGGLFCVELNPETGLTLKEGDKGHLTARRAEYQTRNLEAPEIIYNPDLKKYYLFTSYDALFSHYNIRVGRSDKPEGPFFDYFGHDLADTTNNFPILTYAYRFAGHPGWAGVGHCGVIMDGEQYFMFHQGRLAPDNLMMVLHVREIFWTSDGWPVVSPERYAAVPQTEIDYRDIAGTWEMITLNEVVDTVVLWQGQIPPGGWHYDTTMFNNPVVVSFTKDGRVENLTGHNWIMDKGHLLIESREGTTEFIVSNAWDWERENPTIIATGINAGGIGVYGKKLE